ncbi:thaumatin family protein [Streptacidiphilus sp. MAP12-16]|uniref:thaumatin family protein n=1 Tax=Streptacidiphilus sp. MAP12-16 TaxID=3156300 RepID=UPI003519928B
MRQWLAVTLAAVVVAVLSIVLYSPSGRQGSTVAAEGATTGVSAPVGSGTGATTASGVPSTRSSASTSARASATASARANGTAAASSVRPVPPAGVPPVAAPGHRTVTFVNALQQTVWVGSGQQTAKPALTTTGWVLKPGQVLSISVPDHWNGRFWGRTGCSFDASGSGHCQTGDCGGRFQCPGYGTIPATLAEFNLNAWSGLDFYDVSMVDGSNLPMWINLVGGASKDKISASGCSAAGCTRPVVCPAALQIHAGGAVVGCESPCGVFGTDQYCCRGQWSARTACDPTKWPIRYAAVFKTAEPFAYSYCDDDATSTFTSTGEAGYRITFGLSP